MADLTYTYTGGPETDSPGTRFQGASLQFSFTTPNPLPANLTYSISGTDPQYNVQVDSWSVSIGGLTVANNKFGDPGLFDLDLRTNSAGVITGWFFSLQDFAADGSNDLNITSNSSGSSSIAGPYIDFAQWNPVFNQTYADLGISDIAGTWSFSGGSTPIHWASPVNGNFDTVADWTGGATPGASNDAILDPAGAAFRVTASAGESVNSLQTTANATLSITGGTFTVADGTGSGANDGVILVSAAGVFDATGPVANSGRIEALGAGSGEIDGAVANSGTLEVAGGDLKIGGPVTGAGTAVIDGGTLTFASAFSENVSFTGSSGTLVLGHAQSYAGSIAGFSSTGSTSLDLEDVGFANAAEASFLDNGKGTGGVLTVADGGAVAHVTLTGDFRSAIFTAASDGRGGTSITAAPPTPIHWAKAVNGTFATAGDWVGGAVPGPGGDVILDPSGAAYTVSVVGNVTVHSLQTAANATLIISGGTFTATAGTGSGTNAGKVILGGGGVFDITAPIDNSGLLEGGFTGSLIIGATTVDQSSGGTILGDVGAVSLQGADIIGGTLTSASPGSISTSVAGNILDGRSSPLTIVGSFDLLDGGAVTIEGAIDNTGLIGVRGFHSVTDLIVGVGGASLSGGGAIYLDGRADSRVLGAANGATLTNASRIHGGGEIGAGQMTLINAAGGIVLNNTAKALVIDTGSNTIANAGIIKSDGAGGIMVASGVDNTGVLAVAAGVLTLEQAVTGGERRGSRAGRWTLNPALRKMSASASGPGPWSWAIPRPTAG